MSDNPVRIDTLVLSGSVLTIQDQVIFVNGSPVGTGNFALDISLVKTTGDQGISGFKIFSSTEIRSGILVAPNNFSTINRTLSSSTGIVFDYQNGLFYNTGSLNTIDVANRLLKSGNSILTLAPSLNWNTKQLFGEWITQTPVNQSGIANKAYVDSRPFVPGGVTGLSFTGSPYFTGAFEILGIGNINVILSGQSILFSGTTSTGAIVDWNEINNVPTGFAPDSTNINITGGSLLPSATFSGVSGVKVVQSGNSVLFAGPFTGGFLDLSKQVRINNSFGNFVFTGAYITASGATFFVNPSYAASTKINGITGDIIITGLAVSASGNTFTFTPGSGVSSGISVTGGEFLQDGLITGFDKIRVLQSGRYIIVSGDGTHTSINGLIGSLTFTGGGIFSSGNSFVVPSYPNGVTSLSVFGDTSITGNVILSGAGNTSLSRINNTIIFSGIISTGDAEIVDWDNVANKPDTFPQLRSAVSGNTISLGVNSFDSNFSLSLGKSSLIHKIQSSAPAWIRFYSATGYRTGDFNRSVIADPIGEHGLMLEVLTTTNNLSLDLAPPALCYNSDGVNTIYGTIRNLAGNTQTIGISVTRLLLEE